LASDTESRTGWARSARVESPLTLLREYLIALRALLAGEQVSTDGRYIQLDKVMLGWPPTTAPAIVAAAAGPRTLRLSGEFADGTVLDSSITLDGLRQARRLVDEGRAGAGRTGPHPLIVYLRAMTGADARDRLAKEIFEGSVQPDSAVVAGDAAAIAAAIGSWADAGADTVVLHSARLGDVRRDDLPAHHGVRAGEGLDRSRAVVGRR